MPVQAPVDYSAYIFAAYGLSTLLVMAISVATWVAHRRAKSQWARAQESHESQA